ncbi:MAG: hypothetical protein P1Q69_03860 [Candidatus Thorarchaeota archaeon]|nr:hypothetical protein [Candidatus Thorarchaeota archaeon]
MSEYKCIESGADGILRLIISLEVEMVSEDYFSMITAQERGEDIPLDRILTNSNLALNTIHDDE